MLSRDAKTPQTACVQPILTTVKVMMVEGCSDERIYEALKHRTTHNSLLALMSLARRSLGRPSRGTTRAFAKRQVEECNHRLIDVVAREVRPLPMRRIIVRHPARSVDLGDPAPERSALGQGRRPGDGLVPTSGLRV